VRATPLIAAVVSVALSSGTVVRADGQDTTGTRPMPSASPPAADLPSPETAAAISAVSTLAPIAVWAIHPSPETATAVSGGVLLGPALGYFYGKVAVRGVQGILLRAGAATLGVAIAASDLGHPQTSDFALTPLGVGALLVGAIVVAGSAFYDVGVVGNHVERRNGIRSPRIGMVPTVRIAGDGTPMVGVTVPLEAPADSS
jgi:hypothetical protein